MLMLFFSFYLFFGRMVLFQDSLRSLEGYFGHTVLPIREQNGLGRSQTARGQITLVGRVFGEGWRRWINMVYLSAQ